MKKLILSLLICAALVSCSEPMNENGHVIKVDIEDARPMELSDFVESIKLIPLETTDESLIKSIRQLMVQDGKIYINNDRRDVLVFDENGKFLLSTAKRIGEGPEDYLTVRNIDITNEGLISIDEGIRIREYDMSLRLVNTCFPQVPYEVRSAQEPRKHLKLNKNTYLIREYQHTLVYSVSADSILSCRHEYHHPNSWTGIVNNLRFLKQGEDIFFSPSYISDTLYRVNLKELSMEPVIIYDIGEEGVDIDNLPEGMNPQYYFEYLLNTSKTFLADKIHLPNDDFCFAHQIKGQKMYVIHRNKEGKVTTYLNSEEEALPTPYAVYEGNLIYAALPEEVDKHIDLALVDAESLERIKSLKEDDNQVLVCYQLKK